MRCMSFSCSAVLLLVLAACCCLSDPPASFVSPKVAVIREKQVAIIAIPRTPTQVQMLMRQMANHGFTTLYLPVEPLEPRLMPALVKYQPAARFSSVSILESAIDAGKRKRIAVSAIVTVYPWTKKRSELGKLNRLVSSLAVLPGLKGIILESSSVASFGSSAAPIQVMRYGKHRANQIAMLSTLYRGVRLVNPSIPMFVHESSSSMSFEPWVKPRADATSWVRPITPDVVKRGSVLLVSFNRSYGGCFRCGDEVYTSLKYPLEHYNHRLGGTSGAVAFDLRPELADGTLFSSFRYLAHLTHVASPRLVR